jgi:uncharacterized protein YdhG (YjbR/CyaY superfamily)
MGEVTDYIESLDGVGRDVVAHMIERARELVPDAEEGMSYGMPALRYRGSPLFSAIETKKHVGVYPFSPAVVDVVAPELGGYHVTKGSVGFRPEAPLPDAVIDRMILLRRDEIDGKKR